MIENEDDLRKYAAELTAAADGFVMLAVINGEVLSLSVCEKLEGVETLALAQMFRVFAEEYTARHREDVP